jgi:hypothetical protein
MKKNKIKATIKKSIGNSYEIMVSGNFHSIVTWKRACALIGIDKVLPDLNAILSKGNIEPIEFNEPKEKEKEELRGYDSIINWIDKRRSVGDIIENFDIDSRLIKITAHQLIKYESKNAGFKELDIPKIEYYLVFGVYELKVHKDVFYDQSETVKIIESRAF